jgi:basic amino acid/polyamine antiporter, APA family
MGYHRLMPSPDSLTTHPLPVQELPRVLGPWLATAIVVGCVIGSGVFKKASEISQFVPESGLAIVVWVVVGLITLCGAMTLAEVASLFPRAGGIYIFLREAYGRLFGFLWGWVEFWFLRVASCAALVNLFTESLHNLLQLAYQTTEPVLGFWTMQGISAGVITFLGLFAARGTKLGASFSFAITFIKIGSILALMILPILVANLVSQPPVMPQWSNYHPVWPTQWSSAMISPFIAAMVAVMWPYNGWSNVAAIAGDIQQPQRNIPIAFVGGLILLIVIYSLVNLAYFSVLPSNEMMNLNGRPVAAEVARRLLGPVGLTLASAAILCSTFGALSGNMLVGPRGIFALSRDGLAPAIFGRIHPRYETPFAATMLMTGTTVLFIFAVSIYATMQSRTKPPFDVITDFITFGGALFETLAVATIFLFRRRYPDQIRQLAYRCPGYPVVPAIFCLSMIAVMLNMLATPRQQLEALVGIGFIAAGAILYRLVLARRPRRPNGIEGLDQALSANPQKSL